MVAEMIYQPTCLLCARKVPSNKTKCPVCGGSTYLEVIYRIEEIRVESPRLVVGPDALKYPCPGWTDSKDVHHPCRYVKMLVWAKMCHSCTCKNRFAHDPERREKMRQYVRNWRNK